LLDPLAGSRSCRSSECCVTGSADSRDRFFATVFLGSGLLFLAMPFVSMSIAGGILTV